MNMNSDTANKTIKNKKAEIESLLQAESRERTYSYGVNEKPVKPEYDFAKTQARVEQLRKEVATIRHAINHFNVTTVLPEYNITLDEALGRMSELNSDKKRLYEMTQIPATERVRSYGSKEADYVCRNFDDAEVQAAYTKVCDDLMKLQQAINIANLTIEFEVPNL